MAGISGAFDNARYRAWQDSQHPSESPVVDEWLASLPAHSQRLPGIGNGASLYGPEAQGPVAPQLNFAATPGPGAPPTPDSPSMNLQDWLALSYLTTALGGAVGQYFKKGIPPPPIGLPQSSPPPPTTPTATQASLGLAQLRRTGRGGFGRG